MQKWIQCRKVKYASLFKRYLKYVGTNLVGTIVDTLVLWLLSDLVLNSEYWKQYILAPALSFQCAVLTNYLIAYFYVWRDRTREYGSARFLISRYFAYNLSCSSVFLLRLGLLLLLEKIFGWDVVICNLVALCVSGLANFALGEWVIFRKRRS